MGDIEYIRLKFFKPPSQRSIENCGVVANNPIVNFRIASNMTGPVNIREIIAALFIVFLGVDLK